MEQAELKEMRLKQVLFTNAALVIGLILYYFVVTIVPLAFSQFFAIAGVLILSQGIYGLVKGDNVKSIIPLLTKIAVYEKEKMGREWYRHRKFGYISQLVLGVFMMVQFFLNRGVDASPIEIAPFLMVCISLFILLVLNISLIIQIRKVDNAAPGDFTGYTERAVFAAIVIGIVFAVVLIVFIVSLV